jgi:hypothetical protein
VKANPAKKTRARAPYQKGRVIPLNLSHLARDRGYRFRDRDPVLEDVTQMITDSGLSLYEISRKTAAIGPWARVAASTLARWMDGHTRKPQNFTIAWVTFVLGYERRWVKIDDEK